MGCSDKQLTYMKCLFTSSPFFLFSSFSGFLLTVAELTRPYWLILDQKLALQGLLLPLPTTLPHPYLWVAEPTGFLSNKPMGLVFL